MNPLNYMRLYDYSSENSYQHWTNASNGKISISYWCLLPQRYTPCPYNALSHNFGLLPARKNARNYIPIVSSFRKNDGFRFSGNTRPAPLARYVGGVSDNVCLSEIGTALWSMHHSYSFAEGEKEDFYE